MIDIETAVLEKYPAFAYQPQLVRRPALSLLKKIAHQNEINSFLEKNKNLRNVSFIDSVFEHLDFSYSLTSADKKRIPANGRVVIFANRPIGSLDGLALLRLVSEVRQDVSVVADNNLTKIEAISDLLIPLHTSPGVVHRKAHKRVIDALDHEKAVIIFPAEEVSRVHPKGVQDRHWRPGFLYFARKTNSPLLPVRIHAKNSLLFYGASLLFKPLGSALLPHEMFTKNARSIHFSVGGLIPASSLKSESIRDNTVVKRLQKHVYQLGKPIRQPVFETVKTIAHPEDRKKIQAELQEAEFLGKTRDGNRIYLASCINDSPLLREIGRLREIAFRQVGEGTGQAVDIDKFDYHYIHLVLWDIENLEIAGAYRIGEGRAILQTHGEDGFYTRSLYRFQPALLPYFEQGIELGRSFVNPKYWGKASLDYLWQGLGAYLSKHPNIRYMIGPVSMSAEYPTSLRATLVYYYCKYHGHHQTLAEAYHPYTLDNDLSRSLDAEFSGMNRHTAFEHMQQVFSSSGYKLPVLFKQYTALFKEEGFQSLVFSVDPGFGNCLDGLCMSDLHNLKANKRKRYIEAVRFPDTPGENTA